MKSGFVPMNKLLLAGLALLSMVVAIVGPATPAFSLARVAPDPGDDTTNGRYWYVVSQTPYVRINSMEAKAFFNSRNGHSVTIEHADICPNGSDENAGAQGSGNHTRYDIYRIQSDGTSRGAQIGTVYGRKDMSGACGNRTFTIPNNDLPAINAFAGGPHYGVVVRATHVGAWNTQNGFKVRVDSGVVGMGSTNNSRDSGLQSGGADTYERINIPLRTECSISSAVWRPIGIFDPDNGVAGIQPSKFRVRVLHNGNPLPASRYNPGARWTGNAQSGYMPGSNSNEDYSLGVRWLPGERYVIQLLNVYGNNTLQVGIPFDSAPFDLDCDSTPTGNIVDVDCTATQGQAITINSRDRDGSTQSRIRIGSNTSPNYTSAWGPDGRRTITVPNGTGGMNFTAGSWVIRLDVRNKLANGNFAAGYETVATDNTVRCNTPPVATNNVQIRPIVDPPVDPHIEPTETTNFTARVNVSGFPATNQWGYDEVASRAMPLEVGPTRYNYTYASSDSWAGRASANKSGCAQRNRSGTCISWYWYCEGRYMGTGSTAPTCPGKWTHTCQTYSFTNYNRTGTCTDKSRYVCPSPNGRTYIRVTGNEPDCNVYRCQYAGAPNYITTDPQRSQCERRCNNGRGARPPLYSQGDFNCYQQPSFTLRCIWHDGDRVDVVVRNNGDHCVRTKQEQGVTISVPVCASYIARNPNNTGGWQPNPPSPGYGSTDGGATFRQLRVWGWNVNPTEDEKCVRVVAKPTVKVNGGDIAAGGAFTSGGICGASPSASIIGWPHAPAYDASGTELGAFASRDIFGFSTARISTNLAVPPRSLAFANTPMSGGDRYGGTFGPMPCIADHYGTKPAGLSTIGLGSIRGNAGLDGAYETNSGVINNDPVIGNGQQLTIYVNGDVYIGSNGITYNRTGWVTTADIPALKIIAYGGNIYINPSVSNLDGIYVAQPNGGTGGHIYTCATQTGPIANASIYNSCKTTLTVNGAFIAQQVHLGRAGGGSGIEGGTAIRGETSEEFNYLPEMWLGNWPIDNSSSKVKYDAIISLPPVL